MADEKYRKWEEIVNPALERMRKRKKRNRFEEEIAKVIGEGDEREEDSSPHLTGSGIDVAEGGETEEEETVREVSGSETQIAEAYSYPADMTEEEGVAFLEKRRKLKQVMNEFVSWKESL